MKKWMKQWFTVVLSFAVAVMGLSFPKTSQVKAATSYPKTLELSTVKTYKDVSASDGQSEANFYDAESGALKISGTCIATVTLPDEYKPGAAVTVKIKGTCATAEGFRVWLTDSSANTNSDPQKITESCEGFGAGKEFEWTVTLVDKDGPSTRLLLKAMTHGSSMPDLSITEITVTGVTGNDDIREKNPDPYTPESEQAYDTKELKLTDSFHNRISKFGQVDSAIALQRFTADPTCVEYEGRLYVYGTTDNIEFDSKHYAKDNAYNTHTMSCFSTADMKNWRDEGIIDVKKVTKWAGKSWAPSIVSRQENGKTKFYLYFTNGGDGIGVLTSDSPVGGWTDPIGKRLISRETPTCTGDEIRFLGDPGVFLDDDGSGYIYFGGDMPDSSKDSADRLKSPKAARVCKLGEDLVSLQGEPKVLDAKYFVEDSEINKINGKYMFSYCTNWHVPDVEENCNSCTIAYYAADNPMMDNWTYGGVVLSNPGTAYDHYYNNHHHMFQFKNNWYISYHTTYMEQALFKSKKGYRNIHIDKLNVGEGDSLSATMTYGGVESLGTIPATEKQNAATMAENAGLTTAESAQQGIMVLDQIHTGDWLRVDRVDFGTAAKSICVEAASTHDKGSIEVYLDGKPGEAKAKHIADLKLKQTSGEDVFVKLQTNLTENVTGEHDLYFVFRGSGYRMASWQFSALEVSGDTEKKPNDTTDNKTDTDSGKKVQTNTTNTNSEVKPVGVKKKVQKPGRVTIRSLKNKKGKKAVLKWKKVSGAKGYQVAYGTNKKLKKATKKITKKTGITLKKLKKKKYYVKVRAYSIKNGKKVYGKWSKTKKVKIRK